MLSCETVLCFHASIWQDFEQDGTLSHPEQLLNFLPAPAKSPYNQGHNNADSLRAEVTPHMPSPTGHLAPNVEENR